MIVYLNGRFVPRAEAMIHAEDRGFMFGDGVYEVTRFYFGKPLAMDLHLGRLRRGLEFLRIATTATIDRLPEASAELLARNGIREAAVYWQVTRGSAPRAFNFPGGGAGSGVEPTVLAIAYPAVELAADAPTPKLTAALVPDDRWLHCEIKTIQLLPNVLASQAAADAGADCGILVRDGLVTEATSRSVMIVERGELWTYPLDGRILDSITRRIALQLARGERLTVHEEAFTVDRLLNADEAIVVGSTTEIAAVTHVDGRAIADAEPGPITRRLFELYKQKVMRQCR